MAHRSSNKLSRWKGEGTELGKQRRRVIGALVMEGKGEDRINHGLVSANLRLVLLPMAAELSYGVTK